jgi:pilus assembly protein CpaE
MPITKSGNGPVARSIKEIAAQIAGNGTATPREQPKPRSLFARLRGDVVQPGARHVAS